MRKSVHDASTVSMPSSAMSGCYGMSKKYESAQFTDMKGDHP
jgi:hypothetical protein